MLDDQIFINLLFKRSILDPLWIRVIYFIFEIILLLFFNAFFFNDGFIDTRANHTLEERVSSHTYYKYYF